MKYALPFLVLLSACNKSDTDVPPQLEEALRELGEKGQAGDYVVVEAPDSDRFVQFRITSKGSLISDFPVKTVRTSEAGGKVKFEAVPSPPALKGVERILLSEEEVDRLTGVIQINGLDLEVVHEAAYDAEKNPVAWMQTIKVDLDRKQPERVAEFTLEIFQDVFDLDIRDNFLIDKDITE